MPICPPPPFALNLLKIRSDSYLPVDGDMSVTPLLLKTDVEFAISSPRVSVVFMRFVLSLKSEVEISPGGEADVVSAAVDEFPINVGIIVGDCVPVDV